MIPYAYYDEYLGDNESHICPECGGDHEYVKWLENRLQARTGAYESVDDEVPECCRKCKHLEWDTTDPDGYGSVYNYCLKNIFLPTKKKSCKKQELWGKDEVSA